jgi:hypothetical protein
MNAVMTMFLRDATRKMFPWGSLAGAIYPEPQSDVRGNEEIEYTATKQSMSHISPANSLTLPTSVRTDSDSRTEANEQEDRRCQVA